MQGGELGAADLERLFLGVVSLDDVQHEVVEIDEGFADRARLDLALSKLSPRQEQVVRLRFGLVEGVSDQGCTIREMADELGLTPAGIGQALKSGMAALEKAMTAIRAINDEHGIRFVALADEDELVRYRRRKAREVLEDERQRALAERELARWKAARQAALDAERSGRRDLVDAHASAHRRQWAIEKAHRRAASVRSLHAPVSGFSVSGSQRQTAPERSGEELALSDYVRVQIDGSRQRARDEWRRSLRWTRTVGRWFSDPMRLAIRAVACIFTLAIAAAFMVLENPLHGVFFVIAFGAFVWTPFELVMFGEYSSRRRRRLAEEGIRAGYVTAHGFARDFS